MAKRCRLDVLLVERGLTETREKARALVLAGGVRVNGEAAGKPGTAVLATAEVEIVGQDQHEHAEDKQSQVSKEAKIAAVPGHVTVGIDHHKK